MRKEVRQFIAALSIKEQVEVVHDLVAGLAPIVRKEESAFLDANNVAVGYYVPVEKWLEDHPMRTSNPYKTQEEADEAAREVDPALSEVIARIGGR